MSNFVPMRYMVKRSHPQTTASASFSVREYFCSTSVRELLAYATCRVVPSWSILERMAPRPYVTSHAKTCLTASRSVAVRQPFERNGLPFERVELSVQKKLSAVRTVRYPFERMSACSCWSAWVPDWIS